MAIVANLPGYEPFEIADNDLVKAEYYIGCGADVIPGVTLAQAEQAAAEGMPAADVSDVTVETADDDTTDG